MNFFTQFTAAFLLFFAAFLSTASAQQTMAECRQTVRDACRADPEFNSSASGIDRCYQNGVGTICASIGGQPQQPTRTSNTSISDRCEASNRNPDNEWHHFLGCQHGEAICNGEKSRCRRKCRQTAGTSNNYAVCMTGCRTGLQICSSSRQVR